MNQHPDLLTVQSTGLADGNLHANVLQVPLTYMHSQLGLGTEKPETWSPDGLTVNVPVVCETLDPVIVPDGGQIEFVLA
jgi:hypothetical protein